MINILQNIAKDWKQIMGLSIIAIADKLISPLFYSSDPSRHEAIVPIVMAGIAAGTAIAGAVKKHRAKKAAERELKNRPKYKVDKGARTAVDRAKNLAQGYDATRASGERALQEQTSNSLGQIQAAGGSATSQLAALANINKQRTQGQLALESQSSQMQMIKEQNLRSAEKGLAEEKKIAFEYNKNAPHQDKLRRARMEQAAGTQTMWNGIQSGASQLESYQAYKNMKSSPNSFNSAGAGTYNTIPNKDIPGAVNPTQTRANSGGYEQTYYHRSHEGI